jgi:Ser/Thr protein kinase RdoA (MazF antagonist)
VTAALDRDPAVPQRDLLLDPSFVATRLGLLLGPNGPVRIDDCRLVRVKYRVGARLRVVHRIDVGSASFDVTASTFPTADRSERAHAQAWTHRVPTGLVRPVALDRELTTVFWTFPNDRKLAHLPAPARPAPDLAELLPAWSRSALVSYAPEKTATFRCLDRAGRTLAYAKVYARDEGERAGHVHDTLTRALPDDDPDLRLPRSLAYSPPHQTLLIEALDGTPLLAPEVADPRAAYRRLGRALARLHGLAPPDATRLRRSDPDRLVAAADLIGWVRRDLAARAGALARAISARVDSDAGPATCLHGDVNFRNALLDDGRVALIDLDQVAAGPPAAELGSVLASLRYAGVVGLLQPAVVPELAESFLSGYAELRGPPRDAALRAHTAAALLAERSVRVVTRVRPEGLRRLPALLEEAREVLG